ncbi:hypothetical protein NDU88_003247 [Pleurodeles waltl]|uniref:Uncharacterized protein n=1 Tax=Pleurodeles waltl TaxID=8319 RepID=A0AAV7TN42_PLEWA|nr:hypothetical protein NDU88_003247 [Pleurodeles waltl]
MCTCLTTLLFINPEVLLTELGYACADFDSRWCKNRKWQVSSDRPALPPDTGNRLTPIRDTTLNLLSLCRFHNEA